MQAWYRAVCFGKPVAPWRDCRERARKDLIAAKLGGYDDWGKFWITVPGDLLVEYRAAQSKAA